MTEILTILGAYTLAILLGGMVFFPSVVAPTVFKTLEPSAASVFLRRLFPAYYLFIIVLSLAGAAALFSRPPIAAGLVLVAGSTFLVRQVLVPKINADRDREAAGDEKAGARFKRGHRLSVLINLIQLVFVAVASGYLFAG